jgi:flagellar basal body rod protein FlgB
LSQTQRHHWERQLGDAERSVEVALRMLGRLPVQSEQDNTIEIDQEQNETNTEAAGS